MLRNVEPFNTLEAVQQDGELPGLCLSLVIVEVGIGCISRGSLQPPQKPNSLRAVCRMLRLVDLSRSCGSDELRVDDSCLVQQRRRGSILRDLAEGELGPSLIVIIWDSMQPQAGRQHSIHLSLDKEHPDALGDLRATSANACLGLGPSSREGLLVLGPTICRSQTTNAKTMSNMNGQSDEARKPSCHKLRLVYGMPTSGANPDVEFGCQNPFLQPDIAKSSCHVFPSQTQTPCECQLVSPPRHLAWLKPAGR